MHIKKSQNVSDNPWHSKMLNKNNEINIEKTEWNIGNAVSIGNGINKYIGGQR